MTIFQIEDLVEMPEGIQGIVTSFKSQEEIIVIPMDKGIPRVFKGEELKLIYSFLGELDNLQSDEELRKILSMSEDMLKDIQSKVKERKTKEKRTSQEEIGKTVDI